MWWLQKYLYFHKNSINIIVGPSRNERTPETNKRNVLLFKVDFELEMEEASQAYAHIMMESNLNDSLATRNYDSFAINYDSFAGISRYYC